MKLVKLACFLILSNFFMGTSCPLNEEPEDQTRQKTKTSYEMQELKESNNSVIKGFMSKSNDHKFIYVTSSDNASLYAVEVATKQFTRLNINATANPEVVGKADLSAATNVDYLYPTDNGVMATVKDNANTVGVAQFAGNTAMPEHTWKLTQGDTDFSAATAANDSYKGFMAYKKDGANITNAPYILSENKKGFFTTANTAGAATKLTNISTRATNKLIFAETNFVADKTSGSAYVIDKSGIANIAAANINADTAANITLADNFASFNLKQADGNEGRSEEHTSELQSH